MQTINLKSPAIIFYNEIKQLDFENGCWQLYVDVKCEHCGRIQSYVTHGNKCVVCLETSDFGILKLGKTPISFIGKENAQKFQDEFDSVLVAAAFAGYNNAHYRFHTYGNKPYLHIQFKKGLKLIILFLFVERQDNMFGGVIRYGCNVTDINGTLDDSYLEIEDFSPVLERARRNM
ncbi:MAG: hypothetical protein K0R18_1291 [Bacillales bacterium]|jgi:hypothetical protein|nr:hypothetical protein [Bacillales bacterium]